MGTAQVSFRQRMSLLIPIVIVMVGGVILIATTLKKPAQHLAQRKTVPISTYTPSPVEYQSFLGLVTAKDGTTLTVSHAVIEADNTQRDVSQKATIPNGLAIEARKPSDGGFAYSPIQLKDIAVGNLVLITGDQDLANVQTFTATKLQRIDK